MGQMRRAAVAAFAVVLGVAGPASAASAAPPGPKTYYVSPTGSDSAKGTATTTAWQTLARASAADLGPGDKLLLQAGATFPDTLQLTAEDSGTAASPVTIDSYGTGRATISSGAGKGVSVYNAAGIVVQNLKVVGAGRDSGGDVGVLFYNDLPGDVLLPYVRLINTDVSGYREFGISIGSFNGRSGFSDVRVERVVSHDNGDSGMTTYAALPNVHKNVYIGGSRFTNNQGQPDSPTNSGSGLVLGGVDTATIEGNLATKNGGLNTTIQGGVGIWAYDSTRVTIQRNESYANRTGGLADGGGFDLDQNVSSSVIQFNYSHDNAGSGYMLAHGADTATHTNNVIRYNVSQNDARKNGTGAIRVFGRVNNAEIYQNTISLKPAPTPPIAVRVDGKQPSVKVHIRNNIIRTKTGVPLLQVSAAAVGSAVDLRFQGNDWFTSGGTFKFKWGTPTYGSLSAWRTASGAERVGTTAVGTSADPLFVGGDAPTLGSTARLPELRTFYGLSATSTIVDKGLDLTTFGVTPSPVDFTGNPSRNGAAPDPGAFER
jgi:hypothetical protein